MNAFNVLVQHILSEEGGLANHPADPGGLTNKGVTWTNFKALAQPVLGISPSSTNFYNLSDSQVAKIIRHYWNSIKGDQIKSDAVAAALTEWAWGSGPVSAVKNVQALLNQYFKKQLAVDGAIGPATLNAINSVNSEQLFSLIAEARRQFYKILVQVRPDLKVFENGWLKRANNFINLTSRFFTKNAAIAILGGVAIAIGIVYMSTTGKTKKVA